MISSKGSCNHLYIFLHLLALGKILGDKRAFAYMHKLMLDGEAQDAYGDFLKEGFAQARLFWVADTAAKYAFKILIVDESRVYVTE